MGFVPRLSPIIFVVPHLHWDREWFLTEEESRVRLLQTLDEYLSILERSPEFPALALDGQVGLMHDYLTMRPGEVERIRRLVAARRIELGPWLVQPDCYLANGESLTRNLLIGQSIQRRLGRTGRCAYLPDTFGHVAQLPQILRGFGLDSFIFWRGLGDAGESLGQEFWWCAPNGARVLAIHLIPSFSNARELGYTERLEFDPNRIRAQASELVRIQERYTHCRVFPFTCRDPRPELPQIIRALRRGRDTGVRVGVFGDYVNLIRRRLPDRLPDLRREMHEGRYASVHPATFSTRMPLKQTNWRLEQLIQRWLEPFSTIASLLGRRYPAELINRAWARLIENQFHDSVCGCHADAVTEDIVTRYRSASQISEMLLAAALESVASSIDISSLLRSGSLGRRPIEAQALPVVVFNPHPYPASGSVEATIQIPACWSGHGVRNLTMIAPGGDWVPVTTVRESRRPEHHDERLPVRRYVTLRALVRMVPALGYRAYALLPGRGSRRAEGATQNDNAPSRVIENEFYRVAAGSNGTFQVIDRVTGRQYGGLGGLSDVVDFGDTYDFSPGATDAQDNEKTVSNSYVRVTPRAEPILVIRRRWRSRSVPRAGNSSLTIEIRLPPGVKRIECRAVLINRHRNHRLSLLFPTSITSASTFASSAFGMTRRPIRLPDGRGWSACPSSTSHHGGVVSVKDRVASFSLLTRGLPEYEASRDNDGGVTLSMTLLRSVGRLSRRQVRVRSVPAGPCIPTPGAQCLGRHESEFALVIAGRSEPAQLLRLAEDYSLGLRMVQPRRSEALRRSLLKWNLSGLLRDDDLVPAGNLPAERSFFSVRGRGVIMTCLKQSQDGHGVILRVFNAASKTRRMELRVPQALTSVALVGIDERRKIGSATISRHGDVLTVVAPAREIVTMRGDLGPQKRGHRKRSTDQHRTVSERR